MPGNINRYQLASQATPEKRGLSIVLLVVAVSKSAISWATGKHLHLSLRVRRGGSF